MAGRILEDRIRPIVLGDFTIPAIDRGGRARGLPIHQVLADAFALGVDHVPTANARAVLLGV